MEKVLMKFLKKPMNCLATSSSSLAVTLPVEKPVLMGCSTQSMLVRWCHPHGLGTGLYVPYCHRNGPFSCRKPSRDEQPGYE